MQYHQNDKSLIKTAQKINVIQSCIFIGYERSILLFVEKSKLLSQHN